MAAPRRTSVVALLALGVLGLASARTPFFADEAPVTTAGDACQACLVSVRILEDFLCDPAAVDFLVEFVEKQICPAMGDSPKCHNLAEGLLPTIVQWFRASATPASLCASAGVCGPAVASVPELTRPALRVRDTAECGLCEYVVGRVKTAASDPATIEAIKEKALEVCSELPAEIASSCTDFVENYEPMMVELVEDLDPQTVCSLLGACAEAAAARPPPPLPPALAYALAATPALMRPPPPALMGVMSVLAKLGMGPAVPMMGPGGPGMMGPHPGMMGPHPGPGGPHGMGGCIFSRLARMLGFGPHPPHPEPGMMHGGPGFGPMMGPGGPGPMHGPLGDACDYCKMAVIEAHSLVANPTVQSEVVNYTKAVCDQFPTMADPCKAYVDMYAPLVFTLLQQYLVPDTICAQTGMCPPPPKPGATGDEMAMARPPPHGSLLGDLYDTVTGWLGLAGPEHDRERAEDEQAERDRMTADLTAAAEARIAAAVAAAPRSVAAVPLRAATATAARGGAGGMMGADGAKPMRQAGGLLGPGGVRQMDLVAEQSGQGAVAKPQGMGGMMGGHGQGMGMGRQAAAGGAGAGAMGALMSHNLQRMADSVDAQLREEQAQAKRP
ncbi:hypothetical protein HYH03_016562 [Edaphochlamys debaryana]|uniref:Saposin B-type domain-containing protein n=1 Tax=Edaphochlamys debaryana TaxID=47281 RepID=A0A835XIB7_9CHLO|nr:hypothetical protein HYH03_016562 [Edaphochlamys debaryana]|eukprot:KAG2484608.1 hypothetical protein HYH03_016562 [Edaphochlamys debaryana]